MLGSERKVSIAILGAGPTGLGAAWRLAKSGSTDFVLLDANATPGGRAASHTTPEGFTFDHGGHVLFPHPEYSTFINLLNELVPAWHESVPVRGVWIEGRLIPTPVQRNIHRLPLGQFASCLWGLWKLRRTEGDAGEARLSEYLEREFGEQLTRHVMGPLNQKMWAHRCEDLGSSWTAHRSGSKEKNIPEVFIRNVLRNFCLGRDEPGWSEQTRVRYPLTGGVGAIWDKVFAGLPAASLRMGSAVTRVDTREKRIELSDGSSVVYDKLVSSIPLDLFLKLVGGELSKEASLFKVASVQIHGFGIEGKIPRQFERVHAFSVPSREIPFWRVNFPSNFSPGNVPDAENTWSVLCETSLSSGAPVPNAEDVLRGLRRMNVVPADSRVLSRWSCYLGHGYPVPFAGRDELLARVQGWLEALDIFSRGRFGGWKYEVSNQDHAFMQGVEVAERVMGVGTETTYRWGLA